MLTAVSTTRAQSSARRPSPWMGSTSAAGLGTQLFRGLQQGRLPPRRDNNTGAFGGQQACDAVADAHAGTADDGNFAFQSEVHIVYPLAAVTSAVTGSFRH